MSDFLPGQASYLAVLRPFEMGGSLAPLPGASFPDWLSSDGQLSLTLPPSLLTPAMEQRIAALRCNRLWQAYRDRPLFKLTKENRESLNSCPPCSRPVRKFEPFCEQRLCPFCFGRFHVERLYGRLAALVHLLWSRGDAVYIALDAGQLPTLGDGHFPEWEPAKDRPPDGTAADEQRRGLIDVCRPRQHCTAADQRSFRGGVRVLCPLPPEGPGGTYSAGQPCLTVRWLRVHTAPPTRMIRFVGLGGGDELFLSRKVEQLADLVPLVAATCEFPTWMLAQDASADAVSRILKWSGDRQYRVSFGDLVPSQLEGQLFGRLSKADVARYDRFKKAFYQGYSDVVGRPLTDVYREVKRLADEHGVSTVPPFSLPPKPAKPSRHGRTPQETVREALQLALPGWEPLGAQTPPTPAAFPGMQAGDPSQLRVVQGPDGTWYLVVPLNQAAVSALSPALAVDTGPTVGHNPPPTPARQELGRSDGIDLNDWSPLPSGLL